MIEAYAIGVSAKLEDGVTPAVLRIIESLTRANAAMLEFTANTRAMATSLKSATRSATALGETSGALTRASYVLDTMAASSADIAKNLTEARTAGAGMGRNGMGAGSGGGGTNGPSRSSGNMAAGAGVTAAFGLYENARLQDVNLMSAATSQIAIPQWIKTADELRDREFAYAKQYAFATHGKIAPFGEAMLESSRLLRTLSPENQKIMTDSAMPYAAIEAKLKGIELPEAMQAFIGLAHQAGAYSPKEATPLFESMLQASLTTHASLGQIARAASYALPALHASGANSPDVMYMLATMMQAGILNTKSGTWLNNMAMNALPNTLGSGLFSNKKQNEALHLLGLYKGNKSQFYKNGKFNLMEEVSILAEARARMDPLKFNAATRQAFGIQGQRAAAMFSEPQIVENLSVLQGLAKNAQAPMDVSKAITAMSMVSQADQTIANANMTLMNATTTFMGPASSGVKAAGSFFDWTADFTKKHPVVGGAMDLGLGLGAAALLGKGWKGVKLAVDMVGTKILGPLGKAIIGLSASVMTNPYVLGVLAAGAAGYGAGTLLTKGLDSVASYLAGHKTTLGAAIYDLMHPQNTAVSRAVQAPPQNTAVSPRDAAHSGNVSTPSAAPVHITVQIDGNDVRHQILHNMPATPATGQSGLNPQHSALRPSLNFAP